VRTGETRTRARHPRRRIGREPLACRSQGRGCWPAEGGQRRGRRRLCWSRG
jgi:hypothetical protein